MSVRVGEALTKSTKSRASCGGAMMKAVVENGKVDDVTRLGLALSRELSAIFERLAVKDQIMQMRRQDSHRLRRKRRRNQFRELPNQSKRCGEEVKFQPVVASISRQVWRGSQLWRRGPWLGKSSIERPLEASGCGTVGPGQGCRSAG